MPQFRIAIRSAELIVRELGVGAKQNPTSLREPQSKIAVIQMRNALSAGSSAKSEFRASTSNTRWSETHQSITGTGPRCTHGEHVDSYARLPTRPRIFAGSGSARR